MNAATKIVPLTGRPVIPCSPAEQVWIENAADQLLMGADVQFQRFAKPAQGITQERFHIALDELLMERLGRKEASQSALGKIFHGVLIGNMSLAREGLTEALELEDPKQAALDQAEGLLRPLARDGLIAQREDSL
ncbi:hypothetical protein ASF84_05220 [Pseudomonas sp. Leaf127]|uniref:hypothetical protein n=1 Tax=Pseudomonas sp. Leaf127 TaxID=1736267 RepID=UPI0007031959|nr:hypothetical protein [Pseudomonas sp. Leaf127]KQQ60113.1 hypothetical protein ASF84_05220 [Pseudomonas sp. Leaf127]